MALDQDALSPEHLFDLIDQVAVRRTRKFIRDHYLGEQAINDDGDRLTIDFPQVELKRLDYDLDDAGEDLVAAMVYALDTPDDEDDYRYEDRQSDDRRLMLARYMPSAYSADGTPQSSIRSRTPAFRSFAGPSNRRPQRLRRPFGSLPPTTRSSRHLTAGG